MVVSCPVDAGRKLLRHRFLFHTIVHEQPIMPWNIAPFHSNTQDQSSHATVSSFIPFHKLYAKVLVLKSPHTIVDAGARFLCHCNTRPCDSLLLLLSHRLAELLRRRRADLAALRFVMLFECSRDTLQTKRRLSRIRIITPTQSLVFTYKLPSI